MADANPVVPDTGGSGAVGPQSNTTATPVTADPGGSNTVGPQSNTTATPITASPVTRNPTANGIALGLPSLFASAPIEPGPGASNPITTAPKTAVISILDFFLWNETSGSAKPLFHLQVDDLNIQSGGLTDIRRYIALSDQVKEYVTYIFCSDKGATIGDSFKAKAYLALLQGTPEATATPSATDPASVSNPASTTSVPASDSKRYSFYIKSPSSQALTAAPKLDMVDVTLPTGAKGVTAPEVKAMLSSYVAANYTALVGAPSIYAADLREREWEIIAQNNSLFKGFVINRQKNKAGVIEAVSISNARRAAFRFKNREVSSLSLSPGATNNTTITLRVPDFSVDDQSYVSVYETSNSLQSSFAKSSFSEAAISAAAAVGAFGATGGASFGFAMNKSDSSAGTTSSESKNMNIAYNFPRVMLLLDEECLELTTQCMADLGDVKDQDTLAKFCSMYGEVFVSRVQLGGRLFASDDSTSIAGTNAAEKAFSMKVSAAASFSANFGVVSASASLSASAGGGDKSSNSSGNASLTRNLAWQASGGNTLLANNPPAWAPTVAPYQNWRPIMQDSLVGMAGILQKMDGFQKKIPALLAALQNAVDTQNASLAEAKRVAQKVLDDGKLQSIADKAAADKKAADDKSAADKAAAAAAIPVPDTIILELTKNASGDTTKGTYFTATASPYDNLTETIRQLTPWQRKIPEWEWWDRVKSLQSVGTCQNRPILTDTNYSGQTFKVYNTDGTAAPKAKYETNYFLKAEAPGPNLWAYPMEIYGITVVAAMRESLPCAVRFRNPTGTREIGPISTGTPVTISGIIHPDDQANRRDYGELSQSLYARGDRFDIGLNGDSNMKACQWTVRRPLG